MKNSFLDNWHKICQNNSWRAMIMMSWEWTNAINLLQKRTRFKWMEIIWLFSDNKNSKAQAIWEQYSISSYTMDHWTFTSQDDREQYFKKVWELFQDIWVNLLIYAGFMKIVPKTFLAQFPWINSHPADLLIKNSDGMPKYTGMPAIQNTLLHWESNICCSCCIVDDPVDTWSVIKQSERIIISQKDLNNIEWLLKRLKEKEHIYYPIAIEELCNGTAKIM